MDTVGEFTAGRQTAILADGVIQMMWLARLKPLVAVATALILATAGVAVHGRQLPAPERAREQAKAAPPPKAAAGGAAVPDIAANRALAKEQLALIDGALVTLHRLYQNAKVNYNDPRFSLWGRRRIETLRKTGAGKAEIVAALEEYIRSLRAEEASAQTNVQQAQGTQVDVFDARFRRMEAEIWLNEAKAR
jgi:hypothetical protein